MHGFRKGTAEFGGGFGDAFRGFPGLFGLAKYNLR